MLFPQLSLCLSLYEQYPRLKVFIAAPQQGPKDCAAVSLHVRYRQVANAGPQFHPEQTLKLRHLNSPANRLRRLPSLKCILNTSQSRHYICPSDNAAQRDISCIAWLFGSTIGVSLLPSRAHHIQAPLPVTAASPIRGTCLRGSLLLAVIQLPSKEAELPAKPACPWRNLQYQKKTTPQTVKTLPSSPTRSLR